jgi:hypothetical protein
MQSAKAPALALLLAAFASSAACGLNQAGVAPPPDTIAFPASAVMDSSGQWLFVTNSNADLRYNDGTLIALNLARAEADRALGKANGWHDCERVDYVNPRGGDTHFCCYDIVNGTHGILECDERFYVGPTGREGSGTTNVRIGSFAAAMVLQERKCPFYTDQNGSPTLTCPPDICTDIDPRGDDRLLIGVRGDTSLTFVDVTPGTIDEPPVLKCTTDGGDFVACDSDHRIIKTDSLLAAPSDSDDPPDVNLPDEPYALAIDKSQGLLFVGHLTGNTSRPYTGGFSLFEVMPRGDVALNVDRETRQYAVNPPRLIAPFPSPFTPNSLGSVGVSALKARTDAAGATIGIYASSRYVPQVAPLGVTTVCPQTQQSIREIAAFPNGAYFNSPLLGGETRGIEFVDDRHAFVLQRSPPALIGFLDSTPTDILETCSSPTFLDQIDTGVGPRLFVTCFADGEVYVFDPAVPRLVKTFQVGRGPSGLVYDKNRQVAYVVGFGDNDISVVDLAPGNDTEYSVIQRIGFPATTPR